MDSWIEINIRYVRPEDLDDCCVVETSGFPPKEAATRETIKLRIDRFPDGFSHVRLSKSTHGGAEWHEMRLKL